MSSSFSPKTYDVFISFRGEDTRKSFTSHLHHALVSAGIRAYIDDRDLPKGDTVWAALCEAIHNSQIAIIVFSANYASSKWCLEEVIEILKCRQSEGQVVIPVFYEVDPSDIRKQSGSYGEAFSKYVWMGENSNNSILNKVPQWKDALIEAANVSGWDSRTYGNESQLIKNIVNDVSQKLILMYPQEPKDKWLVGMDKICEKVQELLSKKKQEQLQKNVEVIGIWGMGGIGKTTIARVLFSRLSPLYDNVCFLENIRELSENDTASKLKALSNTLLSELLKDENLKFDPSGFTSIARRLSSKKVLIVLDDVDSFNQLDNLREVYSYAGLESIVILTTRNKHLLVGEVDEIYEAEVLSFYESLELFCLHAFKQRCPQEGYEELSKTAIDYAGGVPLALKVLGSNLYSKSTEVWDCELRKVKNYPHRGIDNVLQVSYDGLDITQQKIFLDIAFFFKGECKGSVERILNACDFFATSGLEVLEDKALITVSEGSIQMHDLLQEMGLNIVRKKVEDPGKRSRLADVGEVSDVLANKKGSDAIEGIILNLSHMDNLLHLGADSFSMMSKLRILKLYTHRDTGSSKVIYPRVFDKISDNLRHLEWHGYSLKSLPTNFSAKMLVEIHMPESHVTELWQGVQDVVNLEVIYLRGCKHLNRLPDLSKASKLKRVGLAKCESLLDVHPSILSLDTLEHLCLDGCKKIEHLKSDKHLRSLQSLSILNCPSLKEFSISSDNIEVLNLCTGGIRKLYSSREDFCLDRCNNFEMHKIQKHLRSLWLLDIHGCSNLKDFSISSDELEELDLRGPGIEKLHSSLGNLTRLRELRIEGSRLRDLPNCKLSASLERLEIVNCRVVMDKQKLHVLLEGLTHLRKLELTDCCKMSELPDNISGLSNLERLILNGSGVERLPESIKHLPKLYSLQLQNCEKLQWLPELPPNLSDLNVGNCTKLQWLLQLPPNMIMLIFFNCRNLQSLPELPQKLLDLKFFNCISLQHLPELPPKLRCLIAANCSKLLRIPELPPSLEELNVSDCSKLKHIPELPPQLRELRACNCNSLMTLSTSKVLAVMSQSIRGIYPRINIYMDLENCKKLDSHSFMESTLLAMMNLLFHYKYGEIRHYNWKVCFPESKVPTQFKYRTKGSSLTITLPREPLMGFIFCVVISPSMIFKNHRVDITGRCYPPEDTHKGYEFLIYTKYSSQLHFDHACICIRGSRDTPLPLGQQLSFEFSCDPWDVKECGVHPVAMSEDVRRLILGLYSDLGLELDHNVAQRAEHGLYSLSAPSDGPSLDLGIFEDSQPLEDLSLLIVENSLEREDLSLLIVEDSLERDRETNHIEDGSFASEVNFDHDDEVISKKTISSDLVEGGSSTSKFKHHFDLNELPNETESPMNEGENTEEAMESEKIRICARKLSNQTTSPFGLNRSNLDLNKCPDDGDDENEKLDFGVEKEELKKGVDDLLKIYIDYLN